uniref:Nuclear receptor subfamily 1 group I member 2 n=1 Tax=Leptobrachium leishanense TaxID=445787 RepID=A0A8C5PC14_9ANUR
FSPRPQEEEEDDASTSCGTGDDDDDGEPKICRACGDKATGYHFNAMTCEGCKGFFRRAIKRNLRLSCPFQNSCVINRNNRRHCQACRLKKCLDIGMKKELIMSDEAVEQRRALIKKKQQLCQPSPGLLTSTFTEEQRKLVTDLLDAHNKTFDFNFVHFRNFRVIVGRDLWLSQNSSTEHYPKTSVVCPHDFWHTAVDSSYSLETARGCAWDSSSKEYLMLPHISDLISYMIKGVIDFAKVIPYFRNLSIEDQIALLKGSSIELCIIRFNMVFNVEKRIWECGSNTYSFDDLILAGYRIPFLEPLIHFHCMLKKLKLHKEEYVLMEALSLFSGDRPGVCENQVIDGVQEFFAMTLMAYIETQRAPSQENRFLFAKIMECVTELRTMNEEHSKQILHIWDIQPDSTPLLKEVFSAFSD